MGSGKFAGDTVPFTKHAADRAAERYGLVPSVDEWNKALLDITDTLLGLRGGAVLLSRVAGASERWLVRIGTTAMIAVYDPQRATIVTVQPPGPKPPPPGVARRAPKHMKGRPRYREAWDAAE